MKYTIYVTWYNDKEQRLPMALHRFQDALAILFNSTWNTHDAYAHVKSVVIQDEKGKEVVTYKPSSPTVHEYTEGTCTEAA